MATAAVYLLFDLSLMPQFSFRNYTVRFSKSSHKFTCQAPWYIESKTPVIEPFSYYDNPNLIYIPNDCPHQTLELLYLVISKRQAKQITQVLDFKIPFCVIQGYVFHHGPSAPDSVVSLFKDQKDLKFVSCIGISHPIKERHISPTSHVLGVKLKENYRKNKFNLSVYLLHIDRQLLSVN
mgnify:CR=1 FL=1